MTSLLISLVALTSVQAAGDGRQVILTFDAPVVYTQTVSMAPPRIVIEVTGAEAAPAALEQAGAAGVEVRVGAERPLGVVVPVPHGTTATVSSDGPVITIDFAQEMRLVAARPERASDTTQGGIPSARTAVEGEYLIGPEDLLEVNVFELPELKTTTRVLGDGTVSLPLIGVVQAAGLTKTGLEARLRDLLEERFLLDPQVTVTVTEFRSKPVSVIGAVTKPGTYQMIGPRTVLQMISEAGGLTKEAGPQIFILRETEGGDPERIVLDMEDLVIRGNPALNLDLAPGDVVNVPVDQPIYVFVDGAVNKPGQIESTESRPITLLQAVARAGGLTERANPKGVHILRKGPDGAQIRIPVNLREIRRGKTDDIILEDGDVVVVPETFF